MKILSIEKVGILKLECELEHHDIGGGEIVVFASGKALMKPDDGILVALNGLKMNGHGSSPRDAKEQLASLAVFMASGITGLSEEQIMGKKNVDLFPKYPIINGEVSVSLGFLGFVNLIVNNEQRITNATVDTLQFFNSHLRNITSIEERNSFWASRLIEIMKFGRDYSLQKILFYSLESPHNVGAK